MKTKFQRVLSVILCVILVFGTVPAMAFAAEESEFDIKTYQKYATKENIHYLLDTVDVALSESGLRDTVVILDKASAEEMLNVSIPSWIPFNPITFSYDLTSIDAICSTVDNFRGVIDAALAAVTLPFIGELIDLGEIENINLSVFPKGLKRSNTNGDVTIVSELIELLAANIDIVTSLLDDDGLNIGPLLGAVLSENGGTQLKLEGGGLSELVKSVIVSFVYSEGSEEYNNGLEKAIGNFDAFVYEDILGLFTADGEILEGLSIGATTTINNLITQCFNLFIANYVVPAVDDLKFDFSTLNDGVTDYSGLNSIIKLNGDYDLEGIELKSSVLDEINGVLGLIFKQIVPSYTAWDNSGTQTYTKIGDNMRGLVRYIAKESGFIANVDSLSDEVLMVEIIKVVFAAADQNGEKEIYARIKDATSMAEIANNIAFQLVADKYTYDETKATYEHVLGDVVIDYVDDFVPLYDEKGNEVTVGSGKTVWEVLNYILNFYLVDKGMDSLIGFETDKGDSYFEKLDKILDYTANDGSSDFDSEAYFTALIKSVFTIDLQTFVNLTAVKALNFAGNESVVTFLYNTVYNILNNWAGKDKTVTLDYYKSAPFQNALSNKGLSNIIKVVVDTVDARSDSICTLIGIILGIIEPIEETVVPGKAPTCTSAGTANKKTCKNPVHEERTFVTNYTVPATGHHEKVKVNYAATCTAKGENEYTCVVCDNVRKESVPAHGHTKDAGKQTVAPTCDKDGVWTYYCKVCKGVADTKKIPAKGHSSGTNVVVTKQPTCSETGIRSYQCTVCKKSIQDESMPKVNHTSDGGKITKAATYQAKGEKVYTCTVCKTVIGAEEVKKLSLGKVTGIALKSAQAKKIVLTWNAVKDATGYTVQYTTNNGITWNSLEAKTNSVTIGKLKAGANVKVKITATIGKKVKGKVSEVFAAATKPAKITLKSLASASAKKAVVTWTALKGVSGYEVMYSTAKNFKKDKMITTAKAKAKKVTLKKLKSGKKYFVKVRAFTNVGGSKVYGAYSKVMNVKVK